MKDDEDRSPQGVAPTARSNLVWVLNGRIFQLVLSFVVTIAVARYLGPDELGVLGFAVAFAGLFLPLGLIGEELAVRDLAVAGSSHRHVLGSAALVGGLTGFLAFLLAVVAAAVLFRANTVLFTATVLMSTPLLLSPFRAMDYWFEATLQGRHLTLARGGAAAVSGAARLLLIVAHAGLLAFVLVLAFEQVLATVLTVAFYWRDGRRPQKWEVTRERTVSLVRQSMPLLIANVAVAFYTRVDQVMLGALSSGLQSGIYAAVTRLSEASYFIPMAIAASFAPGLARARAEDQALYDAQIDRLLAVLATVGAVVAVPLAIISVPLTAILLGPAYDGAGPVLAVHALSAIFVFLGVAQSVWTTNERLQSLYMWRTIGGAALNIVLNLALIPLIGALGAAVATLVAYAFAAVFGNALDRRTRPMMRRQLRAMRPSRMMHVGVVELRSTVRSFRQSGPQ